MNVHIICRPGRAERQADILRSHTSKRLEGECLVSRNGSVAVYIAGSPKWLVLRQRATEPR